VILPLTRARIMHLHDSTLQLCVKFSFIVAL